MKAKELRDQSKEELELALDNSRKELYKLVDEQKRNNKLDKPHLLRTTRKDVARILTVLTEKNKA